MQNPNPPQIPANEFRAPKRLLSCFFVIILSICFSICISQFQVLARPLRDYHRHSDTSAELLHIPEAFHMDYKDMERSFKIFVYPHKTTVCDKKGKLHGNYGSEGFFYQNLKQSRFLTKDPDKAHLFLIPTSYHSLPAEGRSEDERAIAVQDFVKGLISEYPYWNRTLGADHFFVTCSDIHVTATGLVWNLMKNSIRVMCSPSYNDVEYVPHKDVSLPQSVQPLDVSVSQKVKLPDVFVQSVQSSAPPAAGNNMQNRTILGFWRGLNDSYIRGNLIDAWENVNSKLHIERIRTKTSTDQVHWMMSNADFHTSKYCICAGGPHLDHYIAFSIHYGCVPVILSDYYDLPLIDILDWKKFSVIIKEVDVAELKGILEGISDQEYEALRTNVVKVQEHFRWNLPAVRLDAFHMVLYDLWKRHHVTKYYERVTETFKP